MTAIKDLFVRNPLLALGNNGQARIIPLSEDRAFEDLRYELSTFVCDGAFRDGLVRLTNSFIAQVGKKDASQKGVWISGFFGSGKSHFLKMAAHLWANTRFPDGSTAQSLVRKLPDDLLEAFVELDAVKRRSGGLMAAAGTLLGGDMKTPRNTILGVILRAAGLPEEIPQARFRLWLEKEGHAAAVEAALKAEGRDFAQEVKNLHVSPYLAKSVMKAIPGFASTPAEAMGSFRAQFPTLPGDITSGAFVELARDAMLRRSENGKLPCTLIILDEVQQFIGDSRERSSLVTETVEVLSKEFGGHVMVVGAGQNSLSGQPLLEYMKDRFQIPVNLQDADVEAVTRQVLLQKNPSAIAEIRQVIDRHSGEIARHLAGSTIAPRHGDDAKIVEDYPLLPSRRRFWEECFRQLDASGTKAQLRSQLRILPSVYMQYVLRGGTMPAEQFFRGEAGLGYFGFSPEHFEYDLLLARYQSLFGAQNVHVMTQESLKTDMDGAALRLAEFSGNRLFSALSAAARGVNAPSYPEYAAPVLRRINHVQASVLNPAPVIRLGTTPGGLYRAAGYLLKRPAVAKALAGRHPVSDHVRRRFTGYFAASNARLADLTGGLVDLAEYR